MCPTIAAPWVLLVQLWQVLSSPGGERPAVGLRAGQRVMSVGGIAAAIDHTALLGQRRLLGYVVVVAVQFLDILGDDHTLAVLPRTLADAIARIDRGLAIGRLGAEIRMPGTVSGADGLRQLLTNPIRSRQATEVAALAGPGAGHKEAHIGLLRRSNGADAEHQCCR